MAKKSIKQDLILRGIDPENAVVSECGKFFEHNHVVECESTEPSSVKNALVELVPETIPEVVEAIVEEVVEEVVAVAVEAAKELVAAQVETEVETEVTSIPEETAVVDEETSEPVPVKKSRSKK